MKTSVEGTSVSFAQEPALLGGYQKIQDFIFGVCVSSSEDDTHTHTHTQARTHAHMQLRDFMGTEV